MHHRDPDQAYAIYRRLTDRVPPSLGHGMRRADVLLLVPRRACARARIWSAAREAETSVAAAGSELLGVTTRVLALSQAPLRRRDVQDELVCAFDRVHGEHGVTARAFCSALALPERTFRS